MHAQDGNSAVDHVHSVESQDVRDRSASTHVNLAELRCLRADLFFVEDIPQVGDILRIGVIGSRLAAAPRKFIEGHAPSQKGRVLLLEDGRVSRVKGGAHIRGEHAAVCQRPSERQLAVAAAEIHDLRDGVLEEPGSHARSSDASDLLLVDQKCAARSPQVMGLDLRPERGISAGSVILAVAQDHAPVKSGVPRLAGRHDLQLGGLEVALFDPVGLGEDLQDGLFDRLLAVLLVLLSRFCVSVDHDRFASDDEVEGLTFHDGCGVFLHLLLGQVDQQVGDKKYRLVLIFSHAQNHCLAALFDDHAVDRQRQRHILVFFDAAVIVRVQIGNLAVLIQGILLDVQTGRIDVGAEYVHAVLKGLRADLEKDDRLIHPDAVDLVARRELSSFRNSFAQLNVAVFLGLVDKPVNTLPLRLSVI